MAMPKSFRSRVVNLSLRGIAEADRFRMGLPTLPGLLQNVKENGFLPRTIIDVGANVGDWTRMAASVFPSSRFFMFDGDPDNGPELQNLQSLIGDKSEHSILLLGPEEKEEVTFYKLGTGSSVLPELTSFERTAVTLPMRTLDGFMDGRELEPPMLLKLDVQGFELEILRGARKTLRGSEMVILETSLLPYNEGAPLLSEVVAFMAEEDFVAFDFCGQTRRQSDYALFQTDVVFAKKDSHLRARRKFFLHEP
jgi:FkbM family methyltransferase